MPLISLPLPTIGDPGAQTMIFAIVLFLGFAALVRRRKDLSFFPLTITSELKGLAILLIVFGHLGYFLFNDHRTMYPFSVASGVGVDLFLFLSGYGLSVSALNKKLSPIKFYLKRYLHLFISLWILLLILIPLDIFVLDKSYPAATIAATALGWIKTANIYNDFNSPLWFITPIIFYYLLFPLVFNRRFPELAAIIYYALGYYILKADLPSLSQVQGLYEMHFVAFPLGILFAALTRRLPGLAESVQRWLSCKDAENTLLRLASTGIFLFGALYYSIHSGVGAEKYLTQTISLITVLLFIAVFIFKKTDWRFFSLVGVYSYEVYLLHWPLASRYDFFFTRLPTGIAAALYLVVLLGLAYLLNLLSQKILRRV